MECHRHHKRQACQRCEFGLIFTGLSPHRNGAIASLCEQGTIIKLSRFVETDTCGRAALVVGDHLADLDEPTAVTMGLISGRQQPQAYRVYGECLGAVVLCKAYLFEQKNSLWHREMDLPKRYLQPKFKAHLRESAQDKWQCALTIAEADALWLAEWGRQRGPFSARLRAK